MFLLMSLVLALIPLLGVAYIAIFGSLTTVDGLFTSLILLAMSGVFALNALLELKKGKSSGSGSFAGAGSGSASAGGPVRRGKIESVQFFEAHVGQPNRSVVTLSDGGKNEQTLILDGDVRNALPVGQKVQIRLRKEDGRTALADVIYS